MYSGYAIAIAFGVLGLLTILVITSIIRSAIREVEGRSDSRPKQESDKP